MRARTPQGKQIHGRKHLVRGNGVGPRQSSEPREPVVVGAQGEAVFPNGRHRRVDEHVGVDEDAQNRPLARACSSSAAARAADVSVMSTRGRPDRIGRSTERGCGRPRCSPWRSRRLVTSRVVSPVPVDREFRRGIHRHRGAHRVQPVRQGPPPRWSQRRGLLRLRARAGACQAAAVQGNRLRPDRHRAGHARRFVTAVAGCSAPVHDSTHRRVTVRSSTARRAGVVHSAPGQWPGGT